jgi:MFS transporter, ACS family, aldohexuronate transporter
MPRPPPRRLRYHAALMRRFLPCVAMMLVSLISYIDRNTLALLSPTILAETHLSGAQYGWIISAFSFAYMLGNPLWGRALDRFGVWAGMLAAVTIWSLASAAHAWAAGLIGFALARALLGFGEGATFPGGLRTATLTLPPDRRARGIAIAYSGGSLGAVATPIVITPIALRYGWRAAFVATGILGGTWVLLWLWLARGRIELRAPSPSPSGPLSLGDPRLGDPRLWAFMALYALGAAPLAFVLYAAPIYLNRALHQSQAELGHWLWLPPLGWELGYFFWGWVTDRDRHDRDVRRRVAALALASLLLLVTPLVERVGLVVAALSCAMFVAAGFIITSIAYATRTFGTAQSGLLAGLGAGSWSALVAALMPLFGRLFDARRYDLAFAVAAVIPLGGAALWRLLDGTAGSWPASAGRARTADR